MFQGVMMMALETVRLADFLADLRDELELAQARAAGPVKLGVDEIVLTVDVAYSSDSSSQASGRLKTTFWAVLSGEVAAQRSQSSKQTQAHTLTLTLKPRFEETVVDAQGNRKLITRGVDVTGALATGEEPRTVSRVTSRRNSNSRHGRILLNDRKS
jgi:hypothetical protein